MRPRQYDFRFAKRLTPGRTGGKHHNVVVIAIARELVSFMWAIAKEVPISG